MTEVLIVDGDQEVALVESPQTAVVVVADQGAGGPAGSSGPAGLGLPTFVMGGPLFVKTGNGRVHNDFDRVVTIFRLRASVEAAPVGSGVQVDFCMDGSAVETLTIPAGQLTVVVDVTITWAMGSYISSNVVAVGSTFPGETLQVTASAA